MWFLRSCSVCENAFPPTKWLCESCERVLEEQFLSSNKVFRVEKRLPHLRLMDWREENELFLRKFLTSLKNKSPDHILKKLTLDMFVRFSKRKLFDPKIKPVFIPAASKENKEDHAFFLALHLSKHFNGTFINPLKTKSPSQKKRSRKDRAFLQITNEGFNPDDRPVCFVDDVLTSGATARISYQALKKTKGVFYIYPGLEIKMSVICFLVLFLEGQEH